MRTDRRRRTTNRRPLTIVATIVSSVALLAGAAAAQSGPPPHAEEPPRRHLVLPGLESHELLVEPDVEWYERAAAGLERAYPSFVAVQSTEHPDWPPLSGYVIGERHVVTAHLQDPPQGEPAPRFLIRTHEDEILEGVQVAAWDHWDFGVIEFDEPLPVPPLEIGDDRAMRRGDLVLNIGNPSAVARSGLFLTGVGTFLELRDGFFRGDISTAAGGSGGPVLDLDGRLIGMSSFGIDIPVVSIDRMVVSELQLRSVVPIDRGAGESGAAASTIARLTEQYRS